MMYSVNWLNSETCKFY